MNTFRNFEVDVAPKKGKIIIIFQGIVVVPTMWWKLHRFFPPLGPSIEVLNAGVGQFDSSFKLLQWLQNLVQVISTQCTYYNGVTCQCAPMCSSLPWSFCFEPLFVFFALNNSFSFYCCTVRRKRSAPHLFQSSLLVPPTRDWPAHTGGKNLVSVISPCTLFAPWI